MFLHAVKVSVPRRGTELFRAVRIPQDAGRFLLHVQLCHQRGRHAFVSSTKPIHSFTYLFFIHSVKGEILFASNSTKFSIFFYYGTFYCSTSRENGTDHRLEPIKVENLTESGGLSVLLESSLDDYFYPIFPSAEWKVIFHQAAAEFSIPITVCVHPHL